MPELLTAILQPPFVGLPIEPASATANGSGSKEPRVLRKLFSEEQPLRILEEALSGEKE